MSTPLSWIEGQARGRKIGQRWKLRSGRIRPGTREFTKVRQRLSYAHKTMKCAEHTKRHIADCYAEIDRLGGAIPKWKENT